MAELTQLEEKVAEVMGLAQAAQESTGKVIGLLDEGELAELLERMRAEAAETEERCAGVADQLDGKKPAIQEKARETKSEAVEMMRTYLSDDVDALDGFEFLMMAEAGELGHVEIVRTLNEKAGDPQIQELVEFVLPIQERHFSDTRAGALKLAASEDPNETS